MFRGQFSHTIDGKGRLSVPARFRETLAARAIDTLILAMADRCLWAYPVDEWERWEQELNQHPQLLPEMRLFVHMVVGSAWDCPIDRVGRVLVPPKLREHAALKKEVVVVGALSRMEIWNRERWEEHEQTLPSRFDEVTRKVAEARGR